MPAGFISPFSKGGLRGIWSSLPGRNSTLTNQKIRRVSSRQPTSFFLSANKKEAKKTLLIARDNRLRWLVRCIIAVCGCVGRDEDGGCCRLRCVAMWGTSQRSRSPCGKGKPFDGATVGGDDWCGSSAWVTLTEELFHLHPDLFPHQRGKEHEAGIS